MPQRTVGLVFVGVPSPLLLLAYRLLGWRLGPAYRQWVHDDVTRRGWLARAVLLPLAAVLLIGVGAALAAGRSPGRVVATVAVVAGALLFLRGSLRQLALKRQGVDGAGSGLPGWYDDPRARRRRNVLDAVGLVLVVGATLTSVVLRSS